MGGEERTGDSKLELETLGLGGGGVRAVSMATLTQILRELSWRDRGGLTPPARPPPQPLATGSEREGAGPTANRLARSRPGGVPYANVIVCICKYASVPAPVTVAGGREPEGVGKGAEGDQEFRGLGAERRARQAGAGGPGNEAGRGS